MNIIPVKVINNSIYALNDFITQGRPKTYLNASVAAASGTITVFSISGFSAGNYYALIGEIGTGNAEIIKMHGSTAPTGSTITLAANTGFAHDANEPVYFLAFNQFSFSRAASATGAKVTTGLGAKAIDPTKKWTICPDATNTSGFAFVQPYASDGTSYPFGATTYSAAAPYDNAAFNTAEYMINEAMREAKAEFNEDLSYDYLVKQTNECLRDIRRNKNKLSWTQSFNYALGQTARGVFRYSLPTDIFDKYSTRAIDAVRMGGRKLIQVDPNYFFDTLLYDVHFTQVRTAVTGGAGTTTLEIDNSYDFADTGSVLVGDNTLTYTGVTRSATAGVFTGVPASSTGSMVDDIAVDDFVFQDATEGEPQYWTLHNGYLWIYPLCDSSWDNFNLTLDYFKTITSVDSLDDAVDYIQFDLIKNWLKWKVRSLSKNDGVDDINDTSFLQYKEQLSTLIRKDRNLNIKHFRNIYEFTQPGDEEANPRQVRDGTLL